MRSVFIWFYGFCGLISHANEVHLLYVLPLYYCFDVLPLVHIILRNDMFTIFLQHFHEKKILSSKLLLVSKKVILMVGSN